MSMMSMMRRRSPLLLAFRFGAKCPLLWLTYCLILGLSFNLGASSLRTRHKHSLQSDFLITFANATVYLGCHLPQEQILWLHNGEQVSGIEYTVKEVQTNVISGLVEEKVKPTHGRSTNQTNQHNVEQSQASQVSEGSPNLIRKHPKTKVFVSKRGQTENPQQLDVSQALLLK
ncbi:hypothetical protein TCAL_17086 [Tigriopus californicus]|uniref:Uncharacterized protein n=1 Tax=Tigriopus californicus TaxID=6832 RepID=A0A553PP99_TIGCA|nr:hypothetical protein TCAL_17086 [Tigriopus californicus]